MNSEYQTPPTHPHPDPHSIYEVFKNVAEDYDLMNDAMIVGIHTWFPQALEIMENLENQEKRFHASKDHGI